MAHENLLQSDSFYYHPLTRVPIKPRELIVWPDGEVTEVEHSYKLEFKKTLSAEEIAIYYYTSVGLQSHQYKTIRDAGGVKYLVKQHGVDVTLFAIDALISDYLGADNRPQHAPEILKANDYLNEANDRLGSVKQVAREYGIDERSFTASQ